MHALPPFCSTAVRAGLWRKRMPEDWRYIFQMRCLRQILGISLRDRVPNTEIRRRCSNQPTIKERCKAARLRWLGHVIRMPENSICSQLWSCPPPPDWKCTRNAPRNTWKAGVIKDLEFLKNTYGRSRGAMTNWRSYRTWQWTAFNGNCSFGASNSQIQGSWANGIKKLRS